MRPIDAELLEKILHSRAAQCSNDYGSLAGAISGCLKLVQSQPTIAPPPNPPLTLDELREMDGDPVWIERCGSDSPEDRVWALVFVKGGFCRTSVGNIAFFALYGIGWLAYRRKPEEGTI